MLRLVPLLAWLAACGGPSEGGLDGGLGVTVLAPNGGEALVAGEPAELRWARWLPDEQPCDVELVGADETIAVAAGVTETSLAWSAPGVAAPAPFRVHVTVHGDGGATADDSSDETFTISPPATGVSLARDVQPIFTTHCTTRFCHGHESQTAQLDLGPRHAWASLVNVPSATAACHAFVRVKPGAPDESYLLWKLAGGGGACLTGLRMPKDGPALAAAELNVIRGWIAEGARDN
ncbi:MAG TPA: hypothetical protein VHE35_37260 [Kofleriaceae bacterium]|nr:hypothetical protein [Kofleriaceae bacterium]